MDTNVLLNSFLSVDNPLLPSPPAMQLALYLVWAIVLGAGTLLLAGKLARPYRLGLPLAVMAWTLLPGPYSPAYWLGLAFQTPSLMSAVIVLAWFLGHARQPQGAGAAVPRPQVQALKILLVAGVVLGWVLLLDTLAWLPVSVYVWGFSSAAVAAVAVGVTLLWVVRGAASASPAASGLPGFLLLLSVLTLFVLSRLPTGNLWDALLDPWLWVALQLGWLISVVRRLLAARRSPPATRA